MPIVNRVADLQPDIQAWRRDIHEHPELLYDVHRTAAFVADRLRGECDIYVDNKLAQFEDYLNGTLRSVSRGRHQLRTAAGTHDYVQR